MEKATLTKRILGCAACVCVLVIGQVVSSVRAFEPEKVAEKEKVATLLPIEVNEINIAEVTKLRKNETPKWRMIHVWGSWCATCVEDFHAVIEASKEFDEEGFELITISNDPKEDLEKVRKFLTKKGAGLTEAQVTALKAEGRTTNHYRYGGERLGDMMKVLDKEWSGGIPYSVLITPKGDIVWRHIGEAHGPVMAEQMLAAMLKEEEKEKAKKAGDEAGKKVKKTEKPEKKRKDK